MWAGHYSKKTFKVYCKEEAAPERDPAIDYNQIGGNIDLAFGFMISFLFPFIGTPIIMLANRRLKSHLGALLGLSTILLMFAIASVAFWWLSLLTGLPTLIVGLAVCQGACVHYQRVLKATHIHYCRIL
jgi:hypothetical protein